MEKETVYIIWSEEHRGWWRPGRQGYTKQRDSAGKYSFEEAVEICKDANIAENDIPNEAIVPIDVCAYCLGTGEIIGYEAVYPGEPHLAPIGSSVCICQKQKDDE